MDAKDTARKLRAALQDVTELELTHAQALEVVARLQGFRNWHELQQRNETASPPRTPNGPTPENAATVELTPEEREILSDMARRDPSPVYDIEHRSPRRVPTHHVEVPGVGIADRDGGAGVYVVTPAQDTTCFDCGAAIRKGELCTRSADKKGTTAGIRYTRCRTCVPIVITPRDSEAIRLDRHVELGVHLMFRTRENALVLFRQAADAAPASHGLFSPILDGDRLAANFGVRLPDPPLL